MTLKNHSFGTPSLIFMDKGIIIELDKLEFIEEVIYDKTEFDNGTEAIRHGYLDYIFGYFWCFYCVFNNWKSVNELCKE